MTKCIVSVKDANNRDIIANKINVIGGSVLSKPSAIQIVIIADLSEGAFNYLKKDPRISFMEWEDFGSVSITQNITINDNWGLDRIDQKTRPLDSDYIYVRSGFNVDVYVFDSGINYNHVEFGGRAAPLFDGVNDSNYPNGLDGNGHGTHVAAVVGGITYGVAKQCKLFSVKVATNKGKVSSVDVLDGAVAVINDHVAKSNIRHSVANMSFNFKPRNKTVELAVDSLLDAGIVVVNSAGNNSINVENVSPSYLDDVLTIGAIDQLDQYAYFSNYGEKVNVFAPGVDILSASPFISESSIVTYNSSSPFIIGTVPAGIELKQISAQVIENFGNGIKKIRVGYIENGVFDSLFSFSQGELNSVGLSKEDWINTIFTSDTPVIAYIETNNLPLSAGQLKVDFFIDKLSNSKNIIRDGTSHACPFASGVVALRLEEEATKLSSRTDVQTIKQFIIDVSTKFEIKNFLQDAIDARTPNRILFSPWNRSDVVDWITESGSLATLNEGEFLSVFVEATYFNPIGIETNEVTYSIPNSPTWGGGSTKVQINSITGEITWLGPVPFVSANEFRSFAVRVESTNPASNFGYAERTFSITVLEVPNKLPEWINPPAHLLPSRGYITALPNAQEGIPYTPFDLHATDPDTSSEITNYRRISGELPPGFVLNELTGIISGTTFINILESKDYKFVVRATDVFGGIVDRTFSIFLEIQEVAPVWVTPTGSIGTAVVNVFFMFQLDATDADGDQLFYNIISGNLPDGLSLNSNTGIISGTSTDTPNTYSFTIEVTDTVLSSLRTFEIDLQAAGSNSSPSWITPVGSIGTIGELETFTFIFQAFDIDGDTLSFSLNLGPGESFPSGLTLNSNGTITGTTPSVLENTTHIFTVEVTDGINLPLPRLFSITILNTTGIQPPVWLTPSGSLGELWEFYPSTFKVEAIDYNGLDITYNILSGGLPPGLSLDVNSGLITGIPGTVISDITYSFILRVSNGIFDVDREFSITMLELIGVPVTTVFADRFTGDNKKYIKNFVKEIFENDNQDFLYRVGDINFSIPQEFEIYLVSGLPIYPEVFGAIEDGSGSVNKFIEFVNNNITPSDLFYSVINDDIYKWLNPGEFVNPAYNGPLNIVKPIDIEDINGDPRHIGGHHYKSKIFLDTLEVFKARDKFTGEHLYDVIVVNIRDPQAGGAFRPDLITYNENTGTVISQTPDGKPDPGHAYPPRYPEPFQNPIMPVESTIHPHPETNAPPYDGTVLNSGFFPTSTYDDWRLAIPINTEFLDFVTPHSLENMRLHIIDGYGGFVDGIEIVPLWMGTPQIDGNQESIPTWFPAVPLAYVQPGTGQVILDNLTIEQRNFLKGYPVIIDRHLVSTTPILAPTTTFGDRCWKFPGANGPTDPCYSDRTSFEDLLMDTTFDSVLTTFDINNAPINDCTFDSILTTFDGIGLELYNKYIKFPPGDKYWDAIRKTIIHKLRKQLPAIDIKE